MADQVLMRQMLAVCGLCNDAPPNQMHVIQETAKIMALEQNLPVTVIEWMPAALGEAIVNMDLEQEKRTGIKGKLDYIIQRVKPADWDVEIDALNTDGADVGFHIVE
eukprot:2104758-Ditylum_brightwellii.AAC.3